MTRVNVNKPASLAAINWLLSRSGFDVRIANGRGYYYVFSDDDAVMDALLASAHMEQGLYGLGPYLNRHSARTWIEAVSDKFLHEDASDIRKALLRCVSA
jgi:hypothetical protein